MSLIENELSSIRYGSKPAELYLPIEYAMSMGGKRLRPLFVLMSCNLFGGNVKKAVSPSLAIEVFHNFTLVHDDIMDNAPLRRNKPTVYKKWNNNIALLSGDVMLVWAYRLLARGDEKKFFKIMTVFNEAAIKVCEGQQLDMNFENRDKVPIREYIEMISLKTAALIAASMKTGAILGGASENDSNNLFQFGKNIGIAFQLQDDLLDVFGDTEKFGKQTGGDIVANKKTFLLLKAFELSDSKTIKKLEALLNLKGSRSQKVKGVKEIYMALGVKQETERAIQHYFSLAKRNFTKIGGDSEKKEVFMEFVTGLMKREA